MLLITGIGALGSLILSAIVIWAAFYEMIFGRNVPGPLGRAYISPRGMGSSSQWDSSQWRRNGFIVLGLGMILFFVGLTLVLMAVR
jgi:hypothetical protein